MEVVKNIIAILILFVLCLKVNAQENIGARKLQPLWIVSTMKNVDKNTYVMFLNGNVIFSWSYEGIHYSVIPLDKLVVKYRPDVDVPYVEFINGGSYVTITCRKSFWKSGIYEPLKKEEIKEQTPVLEKEEINSFGVVNMPDPSFAKAFEDHPFEMALRMVTFN